jgi:hypothetical protein
VSEARRVLNEAKERGQTAEEGDRVELRAWDAVEVDRRVEALREGLDIE